MGKRKKQDTSKHATSEYQIGGGEMPEVSKWWKHQIGDSDRIRIISLTHRSLTLNMHLNGVLLTPGDFVGEAAKSVKIFLHALSKKDGVVDLAQLTPVGLLALQVLEKNLLESASVRAVWGQIFFASAVIAWNACASWMLFFGTLALAWLVSFASGLSLVRQFLLPRFLVFCEPQIVPITLTPLLLAGPAVMASCMHSSSLRSWYPLAAALPALATCALSNHVASGPAVRGVYKLSLAAVVFYNGFLLVYLFLFVNRWNALAAALIFNWGLCAGFAGMLFLAVLVSGAFFSDLISAARRRPFWKSTCSVLALASSISAYTTLSSIWFWLMVGLCVGSALVTIPAPSGKAKIRIQAALSLSLDILQYLVMLFQTLMATFVIFNTSTGMGMQWVKYLLRKKQ